jgi:hypothetical protein
VPDPGGFVQIVAAARGGSGEFNDLELAASAEVAFSRDHLGVAPESSHGPPVVDRLSVRQRVRNPVAGSSPACAAIALRTG